MARWRKRHPVALPVTHHGRAELVNAFALALFRRDIGEDNFLGAVRDLEDDFAAGRLVRPDLPWRRALDRAADLSRLHTPRLGTRPLDVIHVASALELGCRSFVSYDERQTALAKAMRLRVSSPA